MCKGGDYMALSRKRLKEIYGVDIVYDHWLEEYKMYTADGCKWCNGLRTVKEAEEECKLFADTFKGIKKQYEEGYV